MCWIVAAVLFTMSIRNLDAGLSVHAQEPAFAFAIVVVSLNGLFGLYRQNNRLEPPAYVGRLLLATAIGAPIAYFTSSHLPGSSGFRETLDDAVFVAFFGLIIVRLAVIAPFVKRAEPHRVLVLGTGPEATAVEALLTMASPSNFQLTGCYALAAVREAAVPPTSIVRHDGTLQQIVRELRVDEIVVAVREQRGGVLPLDSLLECRLAGVQVTDLPHFFETMQGRIPIESLKASWLIYGSGFRQSPFHTVVKRFFDVAVAASLAIAMLPVIVLTAFLIALEDGGAVIYRQERVGLRGRPFNLLKFRSMRQDAEKDGQPQWAAVGDPRVTPLGRFLRRSRIDELPQLWNVFRGEMSFVGPRPERSAFVAMLSEQVPFYAIRHSIKPGLTGWAQVRYSYGGNVEQSVCKLEYDLYYVKNHSLLLDFRILFETIRVVLSGHGAR
jgi:sugar transferase (PEP-CTERM system associated)